MTDASVMELGEEARISARFGYGRDDLGRRLDASKWAVDRTVDFLRRNGVDVEAPPIRMRKRLEEIAQFTKNEADILLTGTPFCIEVKGRPDLRFIEARDVRYRDVSVDTVSGYHAKRRVPLVYVMVSGLAGGGIVLPTYTERFWRKGRELDRKRKIRDWFYFAPKSQFVKRSWLVGLCAQLQQSGPDQEEQILLRHGYPPGMIPRLYPRE